MRQDCFSFLLPPLSEEGLSDLFLNLSFFKALNNLEWEEPNG